MQRRATGHAPPSSTAATGAPSSSSTTSGFARGSPFSSRRGNPGKKRKLNPLLFLVALAVLLMMLSWMYFPDKVVQVEQEAQMVGHELAETARRAEHNVQDWIENHGGRNAVGGGGIPPSSSSSTLDQGSSSSDAASAAMREQSSKWVDGEKKLKQKLKVLYDKQQNGELLGVPVLTRWLGEDFPAWVTPDMDEAQWRKDVAARYKEMRQEEEQWKIDMQRIIDQRERDLGITTA